jgi:hypothetical protein
MFASIGAEFDKTAEYEQKADYHAIKTAKEFVELRAARAASIMLQNDLQTHSSMEFYRKFFQKHAVVFARRGLSSEFDCRNVSACVVALIRELS